MTCFFFNLKAHLLKKRSVQSSHDSDTIESLLAETGLENCRNTKIRDLSGGEKKRLSLAVQVTFPIDNMIDGL